MYRIYIQHRIELILFCFDNIARRSGSVYATELRGASRELLPIANIETVALNDARHLEHRLQRNDSVASCISFGLLEIGVHNAELAFRESQCYFGNRN